MVAVRLIPSCPLTAVDAAIVQQQAMDIWEQASGLRRLGKVPSIADFEKLLVTAKLQKASIAAVAAKVSPEDMSVRCVAAPQPRLRSLAPCVALGRPSNQCGRRQ